ncbi:DUF1289 domain-containing protein [Roseiarcus sp.]|uniref:DUF1289 domain-containing protein n=1 Tax=Roseiarcus sp. TaxID=1969460 RepID=UPI003F9EAF3D
MSAAPISTPCVNVCVVDPASALCIGCGRTVEEIAGWGAMNEKERLAVMAGLEARLVEARSRARRGGRAGAGRRGG